ncbi:MAG: hypothetical protein ACFFD7_11040 [Candidatus Thorarchaeota archaeon]
MAKRAHYEDLIIDLYLFNRLDSGGGRKKAAKLIFLLEEDLYQQKVVGPHYIMKRYPEGPYDKRVKTNLENLTKNGYLKHTNRYYQNSVTSKFIKEIDDLIQENSIIFNKLDKIVDNFGGESGTEIAEFIYSLPQIGTKRKPFFEYREYYEPIIDSREIDNPKFRFFLDDAWYDSVEILLNPKILSKLKNAINDCQVGNFTLL